jgi:Cof subfamily protein (haloacid dehalogenase superfamily)
MDYRLLAADMDGTLLNDNYELSPRTQAALRAWMASGRYFIPSTGRPLCAMDTVNAVFDDDTDTPFIVYNGAMAVLRKSGKVLFSITIAPGLVPEIFRLGNERDLPVAIWCREKLYANKDCDPIRFYQEATNASAKFIDSPGEIEELAALGVTKILWMDYPEKVLIHQKDMQAHFGAKINCHATRPELFEFVSPDASKAAALEKISAYLNVPREKMAAVGDGYNDLSMLKYAGLSIAMGNAPEDIKKICGHVTLTNNEDGAAVWIERQLEGAQ